MSITTVRDLSTADKVVEFLEEVLGEIGTDSFMDYAEQYGEPGYSADGETPLIVLGSYWCRCANYEDERWPDSPLHSVWVHHEAEAELMEEQGVQFEWYDEWTVVHEYIEGQYVSNAYRTQSDSYHWQPSAVLGDDCEWMTPHTPDEEWVEWALNDPERCIPTRMLDSDPTIVGWIDGADEPQVWFPWSEGNNRDCPTTYSNGWHPGQDADPKKITEEIRRHYGEDTDVVFVLDETSQFYIKFSAFYRRAEAAE